MQNVQKEELHRVVVDEDSDARYCGPLFHCKDIYFLSMGETSDLPHNASISTVPGRTAIGRVELTSYKRKTHAR